MVAFPVSILVWYVGGNLTLSNAIIIKGQYAIGPLKPFQIIHEGNPNLFLKTKQKIKVGIGASLPGNHKAAKAF